MGIVYRYLIPDRSLVHPGIPAHDLTEAHMAALTPEQRALVAASQLYEAVKQEKARPAAEPAAAPDEPAGEE